MEYEPKDEVGRRFRMQRLTSFDCGSSAAATDFNKDGKQDIVPCEDLSSQRASGERLRASAVRKYADLAGLHAQPRFSLDPANK